MNRRMRRVRWIRAILPCRFAWRDGTHFTARVCATVQGTSKPTKVRNPLERQVLAMRRRALPRKKMRGDSPRIHYPQGESNPCTMMRKALRKRELRRIPKTSWRFAWRNWIVKRLILRL